MNIPLHKIKDDPERTELLLRTWSRVSERLSRRESSARSLDNFWSDSDVDPINAEGDLLLATMAFAYDDDPDEILQLIDSFNASEDFSENMTAEELIEAIINLPDF